MQLFLILFYLWLPQKSLFQNTPVMGKWQLIEVSDEGVRESFQNTFIEFKENGEVTIEYEGDKESGIYRIEGFFMIVTLNAETQRFRFTFDNQGMIWYTSEGIFILKRTR